MPVQKPVIENLVHRDIQIRAATEFLNGKLKILKSALSSDVKHSVVKVAIFQKYLGTNKYKRFSLQT
jgi:hypothetical protein